MKLINTNLKLKTMEHLSKSIKSLKEDEKINFVYDGKKYFIDCFHIYKDGSKSFSISSDDEYSAKHMNVKNITKKYINLYTFDMMQNKTNYKMEIEKIILINI